MTFTGSRIITAATAASAALALTVAVAPAHAAGGGICSRTARLQFYACHAELSDDYYTAKAACLNQPEDGTECVREARSERREGVDSCSEQLEARRDLCDEIGEAAHDPDMDPALFQDPRSPSHPNPYFPLDIGNRWVYEEDGERIEIEILDATKRIAGIDCIVYRDTVTSDGLLVEDTDDWFGIRKNGDIEYCGEEVKDYEYFEGDDPEHPELTAIDGRFKVGVELAKSGTAFLGDPVVGTAYRQEWDPGNAEDIGKVLSNSYAYGGDPELDELVPQELAELMCSEGDCVVIADQSTLDPGAFERKYYARGIGKFLETKPEDEEFVPIVECNFDPRCDSLPIE
jgi:hypothetical protein